MHCVIVYFAKSPAIQAEYTSTEALIESSRYL